MINRKLSYLKLLGRLAAEGTHFLPLLLSRTSAGFPSPAEDYLESRIDLNAEFIKHPDATFLARNAADADSMIDAGILPGSLLIVDRALETRSGNIVVARLEDKFCVKRLVILKGKIFLMSENETYAPIEVKTEDFEIWGRVTHSIIEH